LKVNSKGSQNANNSEPSYLTTLKQTHQKDTSTQSEA